MAQAMLHFVFGTEHQYPVAYPPTTHSGARQANNPGIVGNLAELIDNPNIHVYPNPTQNGVTVFNNNTVDGQVKVEVKDLLGRVIYTNFIGKNEKHFIPLNTCSNGVYMLEIIKTNKETMYRTKLIKQD